MAWLTTVIGAIKLALSYPAVKYLIGLIKTGIVSVLLNKKLQTFAYNLVIELRNNTELSTAKKALEFNKRMAAYMISEGIIPKDLIINVLREVFCLIVKAKAEKGELPAVVQPADDPAEEKKD